MEKILGRVERVDCKSNKPNARPYGFVIKTKDNETYYAHLGDLKTNEELLYDNAKTDYLKIGDEVEFICYELRPNQHKLAIHVKLKS